jgi:cell division GTPase FtsZ
LQTLNAALTTLPFNPTNTQQGKQDKSMEKTITRIAQMDDWVFEVKMVRALKVKKHREPYSAIANMTANGDQMYIDSHLSVNDEGLSKQDFMTIYKFCQSMGMKNIGYDRIKNGFKTNKHVDIFENNQPKPNIRLVK